MNSMKLKGNSKQGLTGATTGFFVGFAAVALYGATIAVFKQSFSTLNPILLALLIAIPNLSGSLLRIPFAAWVDINGGRKPFITLLGLSIIGMTGLYIIMAFFKQNLSQYYSLLLIFGALSGCGIATFSVGVSQASYWFPQSKQGAALGIYGGVGNLAPGIFTLLLPNVALPLLGLSGSYLAWLIFLIIGTIAYCIIGKNAWYFQLIDAGVEKSEAKRIASKEYGQELFPNDKVSESLMISARTWKTWALVLIYFTTFGGFLALTSWLPTYWMSFFKLNIKMAGVLTALYSITTSVVRVYGGKIADKLGGERVSNVSLFIMLIGTICMVIASSLPIAIIGILFLAVGMGVTNAAVFKILPKEVPHAIGGASGWVGGIGAFGGFVIPPVMASFIDKTGVNLGGFSKGFLVFSALAIVSILILAIFRMGAKKSPVTSKA
ncbi:MFS transporter [Clostridium carboxidivorans P7]|uniref:Major facilitator superfamily MFS_1 n=1 Tax=Clostridium carboxidivorans P7 TaxID=536227 RepID=C6Q0D4_9CLOT|nr:MFS transporter [Clostridium carboxidivorans]AKN29501.1 MFS transporter [Clostridium carboxidivorans P7]EET85061.1 major facilitator superfamily MFS_1 [Clostridium carboxidivorans P7]EFG89576.1 transporter, major facilitator family protein [Clostridium carboxidivorans P7]